MSTLWRVAAGPRGKCPGAVSKNEKNRQDT